MQQTMLPEETRNVRKNRSRVHRWIAGGMSCVMSLCTVLSLVAPAFAQENETAAEPHTHTKACYQQVTEKTGKTLSCDALSLAYGGADGETADFVVHAHSGLCYDETGALVCTLPEKEAHTHGDGCYTTADTHIHDDSCYDMGADPTCGKTAHTHSDECYTCAREGEEGHTHDDTCRTLTCTAEEHTHEAACYPLTCTQSTESAKLTCTKEEVILHTHGDACYETYTDETGAEQKRLTCTQQEIKEHVHTDACFTTTTEPVDTTALTCTEDHEHTALCYGTWELVCGLEETAAEDAEELLEITDESAGEYYVTENLNALTKSGYFEYWAQFINEDDNEEVQSNSASSYSNRRMAAYGRSSAVSAQQIKAVGGTSVPTGSNADDPVKISKTISGTGIENVFDITLTVETEEDIEKITNYPPMAVVLVIDASGSMSQNMRNTSTAKYVAASNAAATFVNAFANYTDDSSKIGCVVFNTHAETIMPMQSCSTSQVGTFNTQMGNGIERTVNAGKKNNYLGYTNIEAGLALAYSMLNTWSDIENQFIVFLSDGLPTTYLKTSPATGYIPETDSGAKGANGTFYDGINAGYTEYGTTYSDKGAARAEVIADTLTSSGIKVYPIGVGIDSFTAHDYSKYVNNGDGKHTDDDYAYSTFDAVGYIRNQLLRASKGFAKTVDNYYKYVRKNGTLGESKNIASSADDLVVVSYEGGFEGWLKSEIGNTGWFANCNDQNALNSKFTEIFNNIYDIVIGNSAQLWTVTDPVPSGVEFVAFYNRNENLDADGMAGGVGQNAENEIKKEGSTITWNLKNSGYTSKVTTTIANVSRTTYTYSVKYRVRLENENGGFIEGQQVNTNGTTTLTYNTSRTTESGTTYSDAKTLNFMIPAVEGYLSELEFDKKDQYGNAIEGAEFTLTHDEKNCYKSQCRGDNSTAVEITPMTEESGTDGKVKFENIPSGHTYILEETKAPNGYASASEKYTVQVSYDTVTVTKYETEEAWGRSVTNTLLEAELTVKGTKHLTNPDGAEHTYTFEMVQVADDQGTAIEGAKVETVTATLSVETSEATFTFPKLTYYGTELGTDTTKTYYYKISEQEKDSSALDADDTVYVLTVTVTRSGDTLSANVTHVNGESVTGEDPVVSFTNTLLGELEIEKDLILLSGLPDADKTFKVKVELTGDLLKKGMVLSDETVVEADGSATVEVTVKNNDSKVTIGKIPAGTKYKVTEVADSAYGYAVSYSVKDGEGTITAKADGKDNASVVITNKELKAELEIPVLKKLTNPDGKEHTYAFKLTQVDKDGNVLSDGETQNASVTMKEDKASAKFVLTYKGTDLNGERDRTYYYLVEETTESDLYLDADASTFLLEVKLSGGDNQLSAKVVSVNGQSVSGETPVLTFTNTLLGIITLEKTLVGATHVGPFTFDLTGKIADGEYRAVRNSKDEEVVTFKNGKATVKLMLNDTLTIYGIPHGTAITIQEYVGADEVRYTINGSIWKHSGYTAETEVTTSGTTVRYINYYYGDLPQTGQLNWPILLLAVLGVGCLGAGAFLRFRRKKGKYE